MLLRLLTATALSVAALSAGACATLSEPALAVEPVFTTRACPADWVPGGRAVECGTLTVDEARDGSGGRRIDIAVAIVRASAPFRDASGQALPPVVVFHGGPGGAEVAGVGASLQRLAARPGANVLMAVDQDWIFFDQRGGGQGDPSMDCPGVQLTDAGLPSDADADGLKACLRAFADQGVDFRWYNVAAVAQDVRDLTHVLNLPKIDLYGGSYGPRVEAAVITHAPEIVRAAVMDSPWPPEGNWAVGTPEQVSAAVKIILAKCQAQAACAARHPDLQARFEANARLWLEGPRTGKDGKTFTVDDLSAFLMDTTYSRTGVRRLPADLEKIIAGDLSPVAGIAEDRTYYFEGQHMAYICKEELPFESRERLAAGAAGDPVAEVLVPSLSRLFDVCGAVNSGRADPIENQAVTTTIPTLFVAAEIDPGCPPALTEAAARGYANSQVVIVTNATHGVINASPCTQRMARDFLRDPSKPVDRTCLPAADTPLDFIE
ncbi:alpha/beta fold hydrolase [Brevundimonas sp.]|uniref:alpha/beta fold hydrolase n=1 Tax=Brevundimonas sp. TaxID=1871086 RepID=UPI00273063F7|nr:alpha/beta hydrolase [Brevundimonas sp.]MDP1911896.1 alpha/beta hydrolase [Brevundimonas sp.]